MEKITHCPVCEATSFSNYLNVVDHTVSKKEFKIQECNHCNFLFTNPRPEASEIGQYYQSEDYISHHDEAKDMMSMMYNSVRKYTINQKLKLINTLVPSKGKLLDIGCGTGNFLQVCKDNHWQTMGTEPNAEARKIAAARTKSEIIENIGMISTPGDSFQIITMWHVLEHVHQLNETIAWLQKQIDTNGKIIIAVPNPQSSDAIKYGHLWAAYDVPRHLYHFTRASMKALLAKHGLQIDQIKPMWFDSYYVSMLSSKYKHGNAQFIESIVAGTVSNFKGNSNKRSSYNTSSLIYIISKK